MSGMDRRKALQGAVGGLGLAATGSADAMAQAGRARPLFSLAHASVPVLGRAETFPVRRIYCIGRNYAAHAREMGSDPNREPPFFFQKPADAVQLVPPGVMTDHRYPSLTRNYHHEVELVAFLKSGGRDIPAERALDHVYGYTVGLDMTRRDLQQDMAAQKKAWEIGKSFDHSAPMGPVHPVTRVGHLTRGRISIAVNEQLRQDADLSQMIWSVAEQIAQLSRAFELRAGDVIYSGTPENVGPVVPGDRLLCKIEGLNDLQVRIIPG